MALEFFTGFDVHADAQLQLGRFTQTQNVSVSTSTFRNGTRSMALTVGATAYAVLVNLSNAATRIMGFGFYATSVLGGGRMLAGFGEGAAPTTAGNAQVCIGLNASGQIAAYRGRALGLDSGGTLLGTSTNNLSASTWYFIELQVLHHASAGTVNVFVNNVNWLTLSGINTIQTANAYSNSIGFNGENSAGYHVDDIYVVTGSGGTHTTRLGDVRAVALNASTGDGTHADATPSSGTDNGAMVDEVTPDDDTTYNIFDAADIDTYNFPAAGVVGTVIGVQVLNYVRKTDTGAATARGKALIGGTLYNGTAFNPGTSYSYNSHIWEVSPATSVAWTISEIDGAEFGLERTV